MARKRKRANRKALSLSNHPIVREYLSDFQLAHDVDWMFHRLNNDEWVKRLAVIATEKEAKDALRALRARYTKMEKLLSTRLKKRMRPKKRGRVLLPGESYLHAQAPPPPMGTVGGISEGSLRMIQRILGECWQTDLQPLTLLTDVRLDKTGVRGGSTADGTMAPILIAAVEVNATLKDVQKWWRVDTPDLLILSAVAHFVLPPAPCDGFLYWGTDITAIVHTWQNNASEHGSVHMIVVGGTQANVNAIWNLISFNGPTRHQLRSPTVRIARIDSVVKDQQIIIQFHCTVMLIAKGGRVTASGAIDFHDVGGAPLSANGLRYSFFGGSPFSVRP